jgi:hypothetical protein
VLAIVESGLGRVLTCGSFLHHSPINLISTDCPPNVVYAAFSFRSLCWCSIVCVVLGGEPPICSVSRAADAFALQQLVMERLLQRVSKAQAMATLNFADSAEIEIRIWGWRGLSVIRPSSQIGRKHQGSM